MVIKKHVRESSLLRKRQRISEQDPKTQEIMCELINEIALN